MIFTINLAVVCGRLLESGQPPIERARSSYGHLQERLGFLLPSPRDTWWEIDEGTDASRLAVEISNLLREAGAPYVCRYTNTDELAALWQSGSGPGLTRVQRLRYLEALEGAAQPSSP